MQRQNCKDTAGLQGSTACAACKHQRKKCTETCVLAPYFPAEMIKEFQAVHKVFGVSNVKKMVKSVNEEGRKRAVDSLIWEACCRQKDPVLGPYAEYRKVFDELIIYKNQENNQIIQMGNNNYKPSLSGLMRWNNAATTNNSNGLSGRNVNNINGLIYNNFHENGNLLINQINPFSYSSNYVENTDAEKLLGQEKSSVNSVLLLEQQQQQNSINYQYYLSGQYNEVNPNRIESRVLWENGSW